MTGEKIIPLDGDSEIEIENPDAPVNLTAPMPPPKTIEEIDATGDHVIKSNN